MVILLDAVLGFLFGFAVYWKWRYQSAFCVAAIGIFTFVWRVTPGTAHADSPYEIMYAAILAFISVRCVMYSFGKICCWLLVGSLTKSAEQTIGK